ncbi:hypothetical protein E2320_015443, partial [Naja naja]
MVSLKNEHDTNSKSLYHKNPSALYDGLSISEGRTVFSKLKVLWLIINISTKLDKLYFMKDSFIELATFICCTKENANPLSILPIAGAKLSIYLKR